MSYLGQNLLHASPNHAPPIADRGVGRVKLQGRVLTPPPGRRRSVIVHPVMIDAHVGRQGEGVMTVSISRLAEHAAWWSVAASRERARRSLVRWGQTLPCITIYDIISSTWTPTLLGPPTASRKHPPDTTTQGDISEATIVLQKNFSI